MMAADAGTDGRLIAIELKPQERLLFRSRLVAIGNYVCSPGHPAFRDSGGPSTTHAIVFARSATAIHPIVGRNFVEGPDVVSLFNRGVDYGQRRVSPEGARCDWFVISDDVLFDALDRIALSDPNGPTGPFPVACLPSSDRLYFRQRSIVDAVRRGTRSPDEVEEAVLRLADEVLELMGRERRAGAAPPGVRTADLVAGAQAILAETFREPLRLEEVARELATSATYLCRVFRRVTGQTLSDYRRTLRVRFALERLTDSRTDLASLARSLGFSSQSHFTQSFRRAFGVTPSRFRSRPFRPRR
jgi:AraC-like DNA-binding protein